MCRALEEFAEEEREKGREEGWRITESSLKDFLNN